MRLNHDAPVRRSIGSARVFSGLSLALVLFVSSGVLRAQTTELKPAEAKPVESYQIIYLTNITQVNDANEIQTALRNMLPGAKIYYVPSQSAITIRANAEDMQVAQKIVSDLNRTRKTYRLTYTITEIENGKRADPHHFEIVVIAGARTTLKQGSRVPIVTGTYGENAPAQSSQVQYIDIGMNIEASVEESVDGVRLRTKLEQSSAAEDKSGIWAQDPVIRQILFEGTSTLTQGKPLVLGTLDLPGGARREEIEVTSELVR
ncbi:hypothetical protein [Acidicapsa ligni]|uniref:hypothetical protein n=1 Tax=Acidicapsa ligni TaxID=542300 RepID=UPI0021E0FB25|nr:hypothetical protein [Acidicapsa ligni]